MPFVTYPGFADATYQQSSENLSVDRAINCYPHRNELGTGKGSPGLILRPGLTSFSVPGLGVGRGIFAGDERMFAVVGTKLIEVSSAGVVTVKGDIGSGSSPCYIGIIGTSATAQLFVVNPDTGKAYYDVGAGPVLCPTPADVSWGAVLKGFGYAVGINSNSIFQSAFLDLSSWPVLTQGQSVASSDRVAMIYSDYDTLMICGRRTTQFWYNNGQAGFALTPIINSFVQEGTSGPFSLASVDGILCMLSGSERGAGRVIAITPGRATRISTYAIEQQIQAYSSTGEAVSYAYQSNGHSFYVMAFPSALACLVYDFTEKAWHERAGWDGSAYTEYLGYLHAVTFDNRHYVMARANGTIYRQQETVYRDAGVSFRAQRVAPVLYNGGRVTYHALRIDQQIGDGSGTQGAKMSYSVNGGLNYGSDVTETTGANGEEGVLEWRNLGQAGPRGFVANVKWDDGLEMVCSGARVDVREDAP